MEAWGQGRRGDPTMEPRFLAGAIQSPVFAKPTPCGLNRPWKSSKVGAGLQLQVNLLIYTRQEMEGLKSGDRFEDGNQAFSLRQDKVAMLVRCPRGEDEQQGFQKRGVPGFHAVPPSLVPLAPSAPGLGLCPDSWLDQPQP